ncbi:hypothetical protein DM02DRAFT_724398 [Periconia macrospinosa]|uniref:Uncharacterized protein n=1 Tax=Periconia macrospinosa TaxID=97972 RepID=A0A2V1E8E4_9PLEO|nr:hypothetical protein DM02DRAFT_724398 [Periconia macrospinosa]
MATGMRRSSRQTRGQNRSAYTAESDDEFVIHKPSSDGFSVDEPMSGKRKAKPKPQSIPITTPLGQMPDVEGRSFKVYAVELHEVAVNYDPSNTSERVSAHITKAERQRALAHTQVIPTWRIWVYNSALPPANQKHLRLFPEYQNQRTPEQIRWEKGEQAMEPPVDIVQFFHNDDDDIQENDKTMKRIEVPSLFVTVPLYLFSCVCRRDVVVLPSIPPAPQQSSAPTVWIL